MAFVSKKTVTIGLTEEVHEKGKEAAKSLGMSFGVYVEQLIRKEIEQKKETTN